MRGLSIGFFFGLSLIAQPGGDYSISGVVVNSQTGEPVRNALVTLNKLASIQELQQFSAGPLSRSPEDLLPKQRMVFAGIAGEFQFSGVAEGDYNLAANKPGYMPFAAANLQPTNVKIASSMSGVQLKMDPLGAIEGQVVNQFGERVAQVTVDAFQVTVTNGYRTMVPVHRQNTDDQGRYRMGNLQPGKYYVKAMGKSGFTYTYVGDGASSTEPWEGFVPVYPGGARDIDSAAPIVIATGTLAQANINIKLEPAYKVLGTLENYTQNQNVTFELRQGSEATSATRVLVNGTTGRFEVHDVVDGSYTLRAMQGRQARGEGPVTVKDGNVLGLSVSLWPQVAVKGVVHYLGAPSAPHPDRLLDGLDRPTCDVALQEPGDTSNYQRMAQAENGVFEIPNVFPGEYQVHLACGGGYATAATFGSTDLLANPIAGPKIVVPAGLEPPLIEITLKPGGGTFKGKLAVNPAPSAAFVLLVPAFSASTGPILDDVQRDPDAPEDLEVELPNLAPGDYVVYVLTREDFEFRNPAFLQSLNGGANVRIEEGRTSEVTLTRVAK